MNMDISVFLETMSNSTDMMRCECILHEDTILNYLLPPEMGQERVRYHLVLTFLTPFFVCPIIIFKFLNV